MQTTDRETQTDLIGTYHSAMHAAGVRQRVGVPPPLSGRLNFPLCSTNVPDLAPVDPRVASAHELREDYEVRECLEA